MRLYRVVKHDPVYIIFFYTQRGPVLVVKTGFHRQDTVYSSVRNPTGPDGDRQEGRNDFRHMFRV